MCMYNPESISSHSILRYTRKPKPKRIRKPIQIRVHCLIRENRIVEEKMKREMELKNLKLYMENMNILKENEKLRKKAYQLHQENLVLLSEIQKKLVKDKETQNLKLPLSVC
ncbi:hypothetical protein L1987_17710 [Smallanthus sonchifolius]|uniref:Uncharacterized protein n=1 Tax=Smallanthus sonchifolius TaxID=185202 RepID=A0ACB9J162_9ASTR|nr:hypothetical protein L1987_17710 [Smallanthus sonchifolius]